MKKRYSIEFKKEAARLLIIDGLRAPEVALKLGNRMGSAIGWGQASNL